MTIPLYQVDAFASVPFKGNPAAICPLDTFLEDDRLLAIAAENNLSETAFFTPFRPGEGSAAGEEDPDPDGRLDVRLRWFTPRTEVDLCGHATLGSAWVILHRLHPEASGVRFHTRSGPLLVDRAEDGWLSMNFPSRPPEPKEAPRALVEGLGAEPLEVTASRRDYLVRFESEDEVLKLRPDFARLRGLDRLGVIATAPGPPGVAFVSRFFAPSVGVDEDPVTGSAHCTLAPYWADRLGRGEAWMEAAQVSRRGGRLRCRHRGDRVDIQGRVALFLEGEIHI